MQHLSRLTQEPRRCPWADGNDVLMREYHDTEWGKPCHDERKLFAMLILEGMQAGLSWATILHKRENFRAAFDDFDPVKIAAYDDIKIADLMQNSGIIRNRLKINAVITNARATLRLGSLDGFFWNYVHGEPIINEIERVENFPVTSPLSDKISADMKKLGFKFIGSTIIYSHMEATGMVNDHMIWCDFRFAGKNARGCQDA